MKLHFKKEVLANGLRLLISEDHQLPLVTVDAFVLAGSDQNPLDKPGLSALVSRLLDEGTQTYTAQELSGLIETTGGSLSTFCEQELSGTTLFGGAGSLELSLHLTDEILRRPLFPEEGFQREQQKVLSRLRSMLDDPQVVASNRLQQQIYAGTPLKDPVLGTPESIENLKIDEIKEFHRERYSPENSIIVIVGAVDTDTALRKCEDRFAGWQNSSFRPLEFPSPSRQTQPVTDEYSMEKEQLTILLGHLGVARENPDFHALQLLDVILGSGPGFTSRIPRQLRDEQGLAYSTYSSITGSSGRYPGRFVAAITTSPGNRQQALDGLRFEIDNLVKGGVTEEELNVAKDYLTGSFVFEFQSNSSVAQFLLATELFHLGPNYSEDFPRIIRQIERQEIDRVARKYLDTINYTTIVVGPTHDREPKPLSLPHTFSPQ